MSGRIIDLVESMRNNTQNVRFNDLKKVCTHYFGKGRQQDGSHLVFKMPWTGDPRINIQDNKGLAKSYQVKQAITAIDKLNATRKK